MNRRDLVLEILLEEKRQEGGGRSMHESDLLDRVHRRGDFNCTPMALRMILRGLGGKVSNPVFGPVGNGWWEASAR